MFKIRSASLALIWLVGHVTAQSLMDGEPVGQPYRSFSGNPMIPDIVQPPVNPDMLNPGHILIAPRWPANNTFSSGPLMLDNTLQPVWDGTAAPFDYGQSMSFQVGQYKGQEVIALWQGSIQGGGYGSGRGLLLNGNYDVVANI